MRLLNVAPVLRERLQAELTNQALDVGAMGFAAGGFCLAPERPALRSGDRG
jgi:hypothetical protein